MPEVRSPGKAAAAARRKYARAGSPCRRARGEALHSADARRAEALYSARTRARTGNKKADKRLCNSRFYTCPFGLSSDIYVQFYGRRDRPCIFCLRGQCDNKSAPAAQPDIQHGGTVQEQGIEKRKRSCHGGSCDKHFVHSVCDNNHDYTIQPYIFLMIHKGAQEDLAL